MNRFARALLPPLATFLLLLVVWETVVRVWEIERFVLPSPSRIWQVANAKSDMLLKATWITASEAVCGFAASLLIGSLVACVFSQSKAIRSSLFPYAIFLQTVPIIAIAPLIVIWYGVGFGSVVLVSFILSVFPVISNMTAGLLAVDPGLMELFRLNRATRWQVLCKLRIPNSMPYLIAGAKTASGAAVIGAIIGEFFTGAVLGDAGLGYQIDAARDVLAIDLLFACVFASTGLGVAIFGTISLIGDAILRRWFDSPS